MNVSRFFRLSGPQTTELTKKFKNSWAYRQISDSRSAGTVFLDSPLGRRRVFKSTKSSTLAVRGQMHLLQRLAMLGVSRQPPISPLALGTAEQLCRKGLGMGTDSSVPGPVLAGEWFWG